MDLAKPPHTLLLPISAEAWAPPQHGLTVDGIAFSPKAELHVTLIGSRLGRELHTTFDAIFLLEYLDRAFAACDWQFVPSGQFLLIARRCYDRDSPNAGKFSRASIIEMVDLPAMQPFHRELGRLLGRELPTPPPHVTLYTEGAPRGIGVPSPSQLRNMRVRELAADAVSSTL